MRPTEWPRGFLFTLVAGWILLSAAGVYYARWKGIEPGVAAPIVAAFLLEYVFYLVPGFTAMREWLSDRIPVRLLASYLALSALAPYLLYSLATGQFRIQSALRLAAWVLAISFWYVWQRPTPTADLTILALIVAPKIAKLFFRQIYTSPIPSIQLDILGALMLTRLAASVMLMLREVEGIGFGFLPTGKEWGIGLRYFAFFLAEEFLARGLLQRWISDWTGRPNFALLLASAAFGFSHLWYHAFPNWKQAILAAALGWFCGKAYQRAGGIRAAMVTHALAAAVYQTFRINI
jgi:membrane protease YdiL (CAAX protease family)